MTEVPLPLFVRKVRVMVKRAGVWNSPAILTDQLLNDLMLDDTIQAAQFVPLEGKKHFTILGVGNVENLDLVME